ncbi:hypothetical protein [Microcoleus sp. MON2_D5]|uniref:hypothetical protein n=1 Tax=Microcoleus sp. MON2_D5 TaxID=2818833 RepID=UPI002FCE7FE8
MMNPEIEQLTRCIEQLVCRIETLEATIRNSGLIKQEFKPLKSAAIALEQSELTLRKSVNAARLNPRKHRAKAGIHYSFKGNRILINVAAWQRDICSIPPENL